MKVVKISLLVLMVFSLLSGICYGQTAEEYCDRGIAYYDKKMYDEAITAYKKAIEINPQYAYAYYDLGLAYYYGKKMYDEAITAYKEAVEINPQYAKAHYCLGVTYRKKKMYDEAITAHKKAIEINPQYTSAHNSLGIAYYDKKMYDEAITAYKKAVEINPKYTDAHYNLGLAYRKKKMYDEAITAYEKTIEINPKYTKAHNGLGLAYYDKKMYDEAITAYKKAIEISPKYADAHNNLAQAYYEKGEYSLAIKHCDRATELGYKVDSKFLERLEKTEKTLEQPIQPSQKPESFFSLSSPENAVKSFLESAFLGDGETAKKCWSKRVPDYLVSLTIEGFQEELDKDAQPEAELIKLAIKTFRYEKRWTGVKSYYVWAIPPGEERSEDLQFKVVREDSKWKVLAFKTWEKEDWFEALIEKE